MTICVFGDSVAWGAWDPEKGGWVNRLRLALEAKSRDFEVYNCSVSGDTTADVLVRFEVEALARKPELIVFAIGDNDTLIRKNSSLLVPPEEFQKNISELIERAKQFTKNIVFLGLSRVDESKTTPLSWNANLSYYNSHLAEYDAELQRITKDAAVFYLEISHLFTPENLDDGVHPNSIGHEKLAQAILQFLEKESFI